jgi:protoheme IX farnesyltransferase
MALGALALVWYNGVYTYLKRITAFAVVPGAVIGAIPPVMGFVAAGGHWSDPAILLVAGFFFLWQIPHFWLLSLLFDEQYRKAGLPTPTDIFDRSQQLRLTTSWMLAAAGAGMALSAGILDPMGPIAKIALILSSIWLGYRAVHLLASHPDGPAPIRRAFIQINAYVLVVMACLSLG